jgi:hypothetical protein
VRDAPLGCTFLQIRFSAKAENFKYASATYR